MSLLTGSCRFSGAGGVDDSRDPTVAARWELDFGDEGPGHARDELME